MSFFSSYQEFGLLTLDLRDRPSSSTATSLAPSPEFSTKSTKKFPSSVPLLDDDSEEFEINVCPITPRRHSTALPVPTVVRREDLTQPDRQSKHYPGFDIHQDAVIVLSYAPRSSDEFILPTVEAASESKENVPPRRTISKAFAMSGPSDIIGGLLDSPSKRSTMAGLTRARMISMPAPASPRKATVSIFAKMERDLELTRTPRRTQAKDPATPMGDSLSSLDIHSPGKTPASTRLQRKEARRMLVEEADDIAYDDEDDDIDLRRM
jgi:hypothetical protein